MGIFFVFILIAIIIFGISFNILKKWKKIEMYIFTNLILIIGYIVFIIFLLYPTSESNSDPFRFVQNLITITTLVNIQAFISLAIAFIIKKTIANNV